MDNIIENYKMTLLELLNLFDTVSPEYNKIKKLILNVPDLDIVKFSQRYLDVMLPNLQDIIDGNDEMFFTNIKPFPTIYIKRIWPKMDSDQRAKSLVMFRILIVLSNQILSNGEQHNADNKVVDSTNDKEKGKEKGKEDETQPIQFNPYIGIGVDINDYGVDDMFTGEGLNYENFKPDMSKLVNLLGIDKYFGGDISDFGEKLKNMNESDIEDASKQIRKMIGANVDSQTTDMINEMLSNITQEIKKVDFSEGDAMTTMMDIAETVSVQLQPKMTQEKRDKLASSMSSMTSNFGQQLGMSEDDLQDPNKLLQKHMQQMNKKK
jgi:hypothetical protein